MVPEQATASFHKRGVYIHARSCYGLPPCSDTFFSKTFRSGSGHLVVAVEWRYTACFVLCSPLYHLDKKDWNTGMNFTDLTESGPKQHGLLQKVHQVQHGTVGEMAFGVDSSDCANQIKPRLYFWTDHIGQTYSGSRCWWEYVEDIHMTSLPTCFEAIWPFAINIISFLTFEQQG